MNGSSGLETGFINVEQDESPSLVFQGEINCLDCRNWSIDQSSKG